MNNWGIMLWANDIKTAEASRGIAPFVLEHCAEILAEVKVGAPMIRDWTIPRQVFVVLWQEGYILESYY
ncbi:MAG: hypothetical protein PUB01_02770 [Desulfovibrionaceae bacterium]|nr:hypothetical protein [Desulfovibrionaceae bacterium]